VISFASGLFRDPASASPCPAKRPIPSNLQKKSIFRRDGLSLFARSFKIINDGAQFVDTSILFLQLQSSLSGVVRIPEEKKRVLWAERY